MSLSTQLATRLFQNFTVELLKDLLIVLMKIDPKNKYQKSIIYDGHLINFKLLNPQKKLDEKIYIELLVIYSFCWIRKKSEELIIENKDIISVTILGTALFYAFIMRQNTYLGNNEYNSHSEEVMNIIEKYEKSNIIQTMLITIENELINPSTNGFPLLQLLNHAMKFEKFS